MSIPVPYDQGLETYTAIVSIPLVKEYDIPELKSNDVESLRQGFKVLRNILRDIGTNLVPPVRRRELRRARPPSPPPYQPPSPPPRARSPSPPQYRPPSSPPAYVEPEISPQQYDEIASIVGKGMYTTLTRSQYRQLPPKFQQFVAARDDGYFITGEFAESNLFKEFRMLNRINALLNGRGETFKYGGLPEELRNFYHWDDSDVPYRSLGAYKPVPLTPALRQQVLAVKADILAEIVGLVRNLRS